MAWKHTLRTYCDDIGADIDKQISQSSDESERVVLLQVYKEKCSSIQNGVKSADGEAWTDHCTKILRDISQLILDVTYLTEVQLVDDDFPEQSAETSIKYIIDTLTGLETLSKTASPQIDMLTSLGPEILECLRWRKGALMYMFCHTAYHRQPEHGIPAHQIHYLEEGVDHLVAMLKTRCEAKWLDGDGDVIPLEDDGDGDTLQLIQQGIFSDTHLLALMYCGELCFWHTKSTTATWSSGKVVTRGSNRGKTTKAQSDCQTTNANTGKASTLASCSAENDNVATSVNLENVSHDSNTSVESSVQKPTESGMVVKIMADGVNKSRLSGSEDDGTSCVSAAGRNSDSNGKSSRADKQKTEEGGEVIPDTVSKMVRIGNVCLKRYLSVAKGPLAVAGWSTDTAESIIGHFQRLDL